MAATWKRPVWSTPGCGLSNTADRRVPESAFQMEKLSERYRFRHRFSTRAASYLLATRVRGLLERPVALPYDWVLLCVMAPTSEIPMPATLVCRRPTVRQRELYHSGEKRERLGRTRITAVAGRKRDAIEKPMRVHPDGQEVTQTTEWAYRGPDCTLNIDPVNGHQWRQASRTPDLPKCCLHVV